MDIQKDKLIRTFLGKTQEVFTLVWDKLKSIWNFVADKELSFYAASLSFYTIFAIIPLLMIFFSIFVNLPNFQSQIEQIRTLILSNILPTHTEVISSYLDTFMQNSSALGMMGLGYTLIASIMFFRNYEYIAAKMFNSTPRKFFDSLVMYWTMITLFPVVLAFSIYFSGEVQKTLKGTADLSVLFDLIPYLLTWIMFFLLFKLSANKPLKILALLVSSVLTTAVWLITKWGFVYYVFYNETYKSVYGPISIFLFMMLWIYISWFVLLYGMRFCEGFGTNFGKTLEEKYGFTSTEV
ncbi:YihY family inner membrane protein [Helicobacter cinaedi]|uniref:YihY family protein n=1 Tax=Helicobacter cinaedi CCUG 18818 = ATCC BAA-847 TaxID=537971 RepID=A0AAI8MMA4_9HELI|nr:YihY family inner membrane protein [Helicobacter cinaedi]AWK61710.1 YihY family inner membrane protein [Helicobacter cinaedi]EFR46870.1 YihY family protein [Helicobacter cinaedi CCUG 18818 = ATCC BAA-847]QOQ91613.1 YihY family inner membrane protein [Helicobacter cinaedi]QOQ95810.1 YihY family inner membrane protein [Helicobacter cinaedi]BAM32330.1 tRNA-processing ribonuclease BN [Helicobacter cinaedi CCUG 18818 = ATCC BAA-847]